MSVNMSSSTDWYTDKNRVAHFVGADVAAGEVSDYDMDAAYKWVNAQLSRIEIDVTDSTTATNLKANGNITMAQTWYACFLITQQKGNLNPARMLPDGQITSQALGQGDVSIGYQPNQASTVYEELTTPNFYLNAQRAMRDFTNDMVDKFGQPRKSIMVKSNAFRNETNIDRENELYKRGVRYGHGGYY